MDTTDRLLSNRELAEFLGVPESTLHQWRHRKCGPPAYKIGKHVRYDVADVSRWLEARRESA